MPSELKVLRARVQELRSRLEVLAQHSGQLDTQLEKLSGISAHPAAQGRNSARRYLTTIRNFFGHGNA